MGGARGYASQRGQRSGTLQRRVRSCQLRRSDPGARRYVARRPGSPGSNSGRGRFRSDEAGTAGRRCKSVLPAARRFDQGALLDGRQASCKGVEGVCVQLIGRHGTFRGIVEPTCLSARSCSKTSICLWTVQAAAIRSPRFERRKPPTSNERPRDSRLGIKPDNVASTTRPATQRERVGRCDQNDHGLGLLRRRIPELVERTSTGSASGVDSFR